MARPFEYFVIFAEMRTGSNFLEATINEFEGLDSHGEVFNPVFVGNPKQPDLFGVSKTDRDSDPNALVDLMRQNTSGVPGFRYFHDHETRVLDRILADRSCAKILLSRNPLDTYVSREIVRKTNQWQLGSSEDAKSAKIYYDEAAFVQRLGVHRAFRSKVMTALQRSGQVPFQIRYEDISDPSVIEGLGQFLGGGTRQKSARKLRKQNPQPLSEKVINYTEMKESLARMDFFGLEDEPTFEPTRGAIIPNYIATPNAQLMFMPVKSGPTEQVREWLTLLDDCDDSALLQGFTQKTIRKWKRQSRGHRTFTVVRHPVARLFDAYVRHFQSGGPDTYSAIRDTLSRQFSVTFPEAQSSDPVAHRAAFLAFAGFVKRNLSGQTGVRVDAAWASQSEILGGMATFAQPDHVFREDQLDADLEYLARSVGQKFVSVPREMADGPITLGEFYDDDVEAAVKAAYQRDYMIFGFDTWR